jgi:hypothetical protein
MFPVTPLIDGHCLWATTRHSTAPFTRLEGNHKWTRAMYSFGNTFPLALVPLAYPDSNHTCGFVNNAGVADNTPIYRSRHEPHSHSDFAFLDSTTHTNPDHFWIPDSTPLAIGTPICVFGSPSGGDLRSSALDVASRLLDSLFSPNTKSVSTGRAVGSSQSVVCHDASTVGGFCGAPGVNLITSGGFKFSFIHNGNLLSSYFSNFFSKSFGR